MSDDKHSAPLPPPDGGTLPGAPAPVPPPVESDDAGSDKLPSIIAQVRTVIDEGRAYFRSEIDYQKARAKFVSGEVKAIGALSLAVALFGLMTVIALVLGLLISLSTVIGPWLATVVVTAGCLAIVFFALWLIMGRARRLGAALSARDEEDSA